MNRSVPALLGLAVVATGTLALASPASAAPAEDCRTITTNIVNRPDNGHGTGGTPQPGYWADDTHARTIKICRIPAPDPTVDAKDIAVKSEKYYAKGTDQGSFVTRPGATLSPNDGVALVGGRKGTFYGTFEWSIVAPADWQFFDASALDGKTVTGDPRSSDTDANPTTSEWINGWWPNTDTKPVFNDRTWSWFYWLCGDKPDLRNLTRFKGEYWWDAASPLSDDGESKLAGDIVGKQVCPSASPSPSPSVSATVPAGGGTGGSIGLPLTGAPVGKIVITAVILILTGVALFFLLRPRRRRFDA